jgi:hypothetical protein
MRHRTLASIVTALGPIFAAQPLQAQWSVPAEFRVLRAIGPSASRFPPGTALSRTARVRLARGDSIHLLGSGGTRVLTGPGEFRLDRPTFSPPRRPADVRRIVAAYRDEGWIPNIWILWTPNEHQDGPTYGGSVRFCTPDPSRVVVNARSPITIAGNGQEPQRFAFDREVMSWGAFGVWQQGDERAAPLVLHLEESNIDLNVTIVALPSKPSSAMEAAELLARHGCHQQLEYLSYWSADAVFDSEEEPSEETPMPRGPDSGWVQNSHFDCLIVEPVTLVERAYEGEEHPCTGESLRTEDE